MQMRNKTWWQFPPRLNSFLVFEVSFLAAPPATFSSGLCGFIWWTQRASLDKDLNLDSFRKKEEKHKSKTTTKKENGKHKT